MILFIGCDICKDKFSAVVKKISYHSILMGVQYFLYDIIWEFVLANVTES